MDEQERHDSGRGRHAGRVSLGGAMEAVLATAIVLAIFRDGWANLIEIRESQRPQVTMVIARACDMAFTGVAIVGIVGLILETRRRRRGHRPASWGPGRWTWAFSGIYVLAVALHFLVYLAPLNWRRWLAQGIEPSRLLHAFNRIRMSWIFVFGSGGGMSLAVALAVAWWAGALRDPAPDAREWAGRAFAFVVLVATLLTHVASALQL